MAVGGSTPPNIKMVGREKKTYMKSGEIGIQPYDGAYEMEFTASGSVILRNESCNLLIAEKTTAKRDAIISDIEEIFRLSSYSILLVKIKFDDNKPLYSATGTVNLII